jgi:CheY-like chemotaxis protein
MEPGSRGTSRGCVRCARKKGTTPAADAAIKKKLAAEAQAALTKARQALAGYLTDDGMPGSDAVRIAQRVRAEAGIELRLSP